MGLKELAAVGAGETLEDKLDMAINHLKGHRARMDACVLGIGSAMKMLNEGFPELAQQELAAIMNETLREAKRRVYDRESALDIAIKSLRSPAVYDVGNALAQIKALVPDLFDTTGLAAAIKPQGSC